MTAIESAGATEPAFSPRTILALVLVGLLSFSGLAVLSAYAPELRGGIDGGAHALSSSAVGYRGAAVMLKAIGAPVVVSRSLPARSDRALRVLTPTPSTTFDDIKPFLDDAPVLIVLPKWLTAPDPTRPGFVKKAGWIGPVFGPLNNARLARGKTRIDQDKSLSRPALHGAGAPFEAGTDLPLGPIDHLQTIAGDDWQPVLADAQGRAVLVQSKRAPNVLVLADADLLNTQGLANIDTARAGLAILNAMRGGEGVRFDVTLNGFKRGRGLGRLALQPPWLAATLCAVVAGLLMGLHGLARFGPTQPRGRAIALGKAALVDNSAGLVRMARKEHQLAPDAVALTKALIAQAVGGAHARPEADAEPWLDELAHRRGVEAPAVLDAAARQAKSRDDLLALGRRLYLWRREIMRERR
jgi:hypothetical protein